MYFVFAYLVGCHATPHHTLPQGNKETHTHIYTLTHTYPPILFLWWSNKCDIFIASFRWSTGRLTPARRQTNWSKDTPLLPNNYNRNNTITLQSGEGKYDQSAKLLLEEQRVTSNVNRSNVRDDPAQLSIHVIRTISNWTCVAGDCRSVCAWKWS